MSKTWKKNLLNCVNFNYLWYLLKYMHVHCDNMMDVDCWISPALLCPRTLKKINSTLVSLSFMSIYLWDLIISMSLRLTLKVRCAFLFKWLPIHHWCFNVLFPSLKFPSYFLSKLFHLIDRIVSNHFISKLFHSI